MKIVKPNATLMAHDENITPYEFIERVGRTCYKSEDHITEGSAERFVRSLVKSKHMAMLEHENIYLLLSPMFMADFLNEMYKVNEPLKYFEITHTEDDSIISGSFRAFSELFDNNYEGYAYNYIRQCLQKEHPIIFGEIGNIAQEDIVDVAGYIGVICSRKGFIDMFRDKPHILFKHLTHTILFTCDRGVSHEFVRHRPCSFAQESTRYCNYSKSKFGEEITVIDPFFFGYEGDYEAWKSACESSEKVYFDLLNNGIKPEQARTVLPNSLKTELIITATEKEWQHIVNLRLVGTTGSPHPQIKEVMTLAIPYLKEESEGRIVYENKEIK